MYLLDNLADSADCGGLTLTLATIVKIPKGGCHRVLELLHRLLAHKNIWIPIIIKRGDPPYPSHYAIYLSEQFQ